MRDYIFRGKQYTDAGGKWKYGTLLKIVEEKYAGVSNVAIYDEKPINGRQWHYYVAPDTVGQFTGILDALGERIFEGDIVQVVYGGAAYNGVIEWRTEDARFLIHTKGDSGGKWIPFNEIEPPEIIGNVHENPELLEA